MINRFTATYEFLDEDSKEIRSTTAFFKYNGGTGDLNDVRFQLTHENGSRPGFKIISIVENINNPIKHTNINKEEIISSIADIGKKLRVKTININQQLRAAYIAFFDGAMQEYMELTNPKDWKYSSFFEKELNVERCKIIYNITSYVDVNLRPNFRRLLERGLGRKSNALKQLLADMSKEQITATFIRLFEKRNEVVMLDMSLYLEDFIYDFVAKEGYELASNTHGIVIYDVLISNTMKLKRYEVEFKNGINYIKKLVGHNNIQNKIYLEVYADKNNFAGSVLNNPKTIASLKNELSATDIVFKFTNDFAINHSHIIEVNNDKLFVLFYREQLEK